MRSVFARVGLCCMAAVLFAGHLSPAQQTSDTFRWIDFHASQDQNIVAWIERSLAVADWTSIREIGVQYDAAIVVTDNRTNPQAAPAPATSPSGPPRSPATSLHRWSPVSTCAGPIPSVLPTMPAKSGRFSTTTAAIASPTPFSLRFITTCAATPGPLTG